MKIKGVTRQWEGGGYYRMRQPLDQLALHGHETSCEMATSEIAADGCDVIVGQFIGGGQASKDLYGTVLVHAWWRDLYRRTALVYELDDDPFEIEPTNPVFRIYSNPIARDSIAHCIEIANLVTASTDALADRISRINPNVVVLKNRIDESLLTMQRPQRERVTIGWAGGATHRKDIESCSYGLRRIKRYHDDVDIHFIGSDLCDAARVPVRHTPWCNKTIEYYKLIDFDIGIAPLVPTSFALTKSFIKALEYAALGIPVVATDVEPYREFVIDGVTGFLIRRDHEWFDRLRDLVNDEAMRREMGAKARDTAAQWTIQQGWQQWESAYRSVS